ncbi:MAG TPA: glycosyltransferase family 2 protein [Thermoanaerobaculia bacterium]|nr:glycosyltransferase family 2 protein [Thermoanaerobaculia bacterium]
MDEVDPWAELTTPSRTVVVMPAYNAARTLSRIVEQIPQRCAGDIIVVDDGSRDDTAAVAASLPVTLIRHDRNRGYGANQKTCYRAALERGAELVVMLHPDYQYDARVIPAALDILRLGVCDVVLGNRIRTRREALTGGMPRSKYLANRVLSLIENVATGQNLGEWHSGFRAYRREVLETVPFERNSDDFVFDSQFLLQAVHFGFKVGDLPMPVSYHDEASSISLRRSAVYGSLTLWALARFLMHRAGVLRWRLLAPSPPAGAAAGPGAASGRVD